MSNNVIATKQLKGQFEEIFAIADATVTGAILGGVHPRAIAGLLSIWFLRFALTRQIGSTSADHFDKWCSDIDRVWTPVVSRVMDFVDDFDGEIKPNANHAELDYLRKECKVGKKQTEIENKRNENRAIQMMDWLLFTFGKRVEPVDESLLELVFIVLWFKMVALIKEVDDETYAIVRQNWLGVQQAYNEVMDKKWLEQ